MDDLSLRRALGLPILTFYGLGTILGAGIYVLVGAVAGAAGSYTPLAFLLAAVLAGLTAFSYAELSARFPVSAGEAVYVHHGFGSRTLARGVGLAMVTIAVVSCATLVNGMVGYLHVFLPAPARLVIILSVLALTAIAAWGIRQAAWVAALSTLIELGGLLLVLAVAGRHIWAPLPATLVGHTPFSAAGVLAGGFIAFYAFVGFEDMVNVAEEVNAPSRNLPRAIFIALGVATTLYLLVALAAIRTVPPAELAASGAPLAEVYQRASGHNPLFISLIGIVSVINGALVQVVVASRILYGMGHQGWLPAWFSRVHPRTRTPLRTTVLVGAVILGFALWLPLVTLAQLTSLVTLTVFALVNLSLWRLLGRDGTVPGRRLPRWVPLMGALGSSAFVGFQLWQWVAR